MVYDLDSNSVKVVQNVNVLPSTNNKYLFGNISRKALVLKNLIKVMVKLLHKTTRIKVIMLSFAFI